MSDTGFCALKEVIPVHIYVIFVKFSERGLTLGAGLGGGLGGITSTGQHLNHPNGAEPLTEALPEVGGLSGLVFLTFPFEQDTCLFSLVVPCGTMSQVACWLRNYDGCFPSLALMPCKRCRPEPGTIGRVTEGAMGWFVIM